jgi:hypothetical protein
VYDPPRYCCDSECGVEVPEGRSWVYDPLSYCCNSWCEAVEVFRLGSLQGSGLAMRAASDGLPCRCRLLRTDTQG